MTTTLPTADTSPAEMALRERASTFASQLLLLYNNVSHIDAVNVVITHPVDEPDVVRMAITSRHTDDDGCMYTCEVVVISDGNGRVLNVHVPFGVTHRAAPPQSDARQRMGSNDGGGSLA